MEVDSPDPGVQRSSELATDAAELRRTQAEARGIGDLEKAAKMRRRSQQSGAAVGGPGAVVGSGADTGTGAATAGSATEKGGSEPLGGEVPLLGHVPLPQGQSPM